MTSCVSVSEVVIRELDIYNTHVGRQRRCQLVGRNSVHPYLATRFIQHVPRGQYKLLSESIIVIKYDSAASFVNRFILCININYSNNLIKVNQHRILIVWHEIFRCSLHIKSSHRFQLLFRNIRSIILRITAYRSLTTMHSLFYMISSLRWLVPTWLTFLFQIETLKRTALVAPNA